jgi:hypothetical protein
MNFLRALLSLWVAAAPAPADLPDARDLPEARTLLDGIADRQRQFEAALNDYTYDMEMVSEKLDKKGAVTSRQTKRYEVFWVKKKRVRRLVAEDGKPLAPERQAQVDADVRKYVDEVMKGKARPPQTGDDVELSRMLDRYEFRPVARERIGGRPAIRMDFEARPGKRDIKADTILRRLAGRVWIDETERVVVRAEIHSTGSIKLALGLAASIGAVDFVTEFVKVEQGIWFPSLIQTRVQGRVLLVKGIHERNTGTFSGYRRFGVESQETPTLPKP